MSNSSLPSINIIKINPEYSKLVNQLLNAEYEKKYVLSIKEEI